MSVRRLVNAPAVARATSSATLHLASPVVDVQALIQKYEAWVPLAAPSTAIHPSSYQHHPQDVQSLIQKFDSWVPLAAPSTAIHPSSYQHHPQDVQSLIQKFDSWVPLAELRESQFQGPIQRVVQPSVVPTTVSSAESKPEVSQKPSVEITKASVSHKDPSHPSLVLRPAPTAVETSPTSSVEAVSVPELHKNQPDVTVENPKPEAPQLPSKHISNGPEQHKTLPATVPVVFSSAVTTFTFPSLYKTPIQRVVELAASPAKVSVVEFKSKVSQEPSVEITKASRLQLPSKHIITGPKQCKTLPVTGSTASSSTTPAHMPPSPCAPVLQHVTPRRSGFQGVASRLFSYETDAKYLKRRAEAKLRRAAAAAKKSSLTTTILHRAYNVVHWHLHVSNEFPFGMQASDSGVFIDVNRLDFKRYAKRPAIAKALVDYLLYCEHNPRKALELAAEATVAAEYKDWWWKARLGKCYYQLGLFRDAEKQFESSLRNQDTVITYLELGKVYLRLDQPNTALDRYEKARIKFPGDTQLLVSIARVHDMLNDVEKSVSAYKEVLQLDASNVEAIACLASNYFYTDHPEVALRYYRRLLQMDVNTAELCI
eukprot:jgi/Phyca11/533968/estExt2_fgenesh1_pg.C_PHYCAscaffold_190055